MRNDGPDFRIAPRPGADYDELRRLYASYAPRYDRRFRRYSDGTLAAAMAAIGDEPPIRMVDVACGTGLLAGMVRRRWSTASVIGVDLSTEMLAQAASRLPRAGQPDRRGFVDWREGAAESLPVDDDWADLVTCTNAFHLVQEPRRALVEFHRVLRPGGRLVIIDWCVDHRSMRMLMPTLAVVRRQRRRAYRLGELAGMVDAVDFSVEECQRFKLGPLWGLMTVVGRTAVTTRAECPEPPVIHTRPTPTVHPVSSRA